MSVKLSLLTLVASTQLVLSGCADPTSASESNYRAAIEQYFSEREDFPHCFFSYEFPIQFANEHSLKFSGHQNRLKLLTDIGLISHEEKTVGERIGRPIKAHVFNLTEMGKEYYHIPGGLCMGKAKLVDLQNISEPYEERGRTYVNGEYTWTIELPDWALEPRFYESKEFSTDLIYLRIEKLAAGELRDDYFTLMLGEQGWEY